MPEAMKVAKGTEIVTLDGIVVVPYPTVIWSHAAMAKQLELATRPPP